MAVARPDMAQTGMSPAGSPPPGGTVPVPSPPTPGIEPVPDYLVTPGTAAPQPEQPTEQTPGYVPVPINPATMPGGTSQVAPDILPREINMSRDELSWLYQGQIMAGEPTDMMKVVSGRDVNGNVVPKFVYYGDRLVDSNGRIVRKQYDAVKESYSELSNLPQEQRIALQRELFQRGFYERGVKPTPGGFEQPDLYAMSNLLEQSNKWGRDWKSAMSLVRTNYPTTGSGYSVSSRRVVRQSLDEQAVQALGRKFTQQEVQSLIDQIQKRQAGGEATSLTNMAEQTVAGVNPAEQQAFRFVQVADILSKMLASG